MRSEPGPFNDVFVERELSLEYRVALSLGHMMMRFSALEAFSRNVLQHLLEGLEENDARAVISGLSFRSVREISLALCRERLRDGGHWEALRGIFKEAARVEERRNTLTHSAWIYSALPSQMAREKVHVTSGGALKIDLEEFPDVQELKRLVSSIDKVTRDLIRWYGFAFLGLDILPDEHPDVWPKDA